MSKFIKYNQLKQLREAMGNGDTKAKAIIDKYMDKNGSMDEIDAMISDYYGNAGIEELKSSMPEVEPSEPPALAEVPEKIIEQEPQLDVEKSEEEAFEQVMEQEQEVPNDISADLDRELDGLIDDDEFEDVPFKDFIKNKKKNALRERKNADYFKAFDLGGREKYLSDKKASYGTKFDMNRKSINRNFRDMDGALNSYSQMVLEFPMEDGEIDVAKATDAYNEFTDSEEAMGAFGRGWDEEDKQEMYAILEALSQKYGKKNVIAMLNTLKEDNSAWKAFSEGKIDDAIGNYGKSLDKLLK